MQVLKENDSDLKVLLAIGGWNHASVGFTQMVQTTESRAAFIQSSINFLRQHST